METAKIYRINREQTATSPAVPPATPSTSAQKPKLLDQVPQAIRTPQYSYITEKAHVRNKRCIFFHPSRAVLAGYCSADRVQHADPAERSTPIAVLSKK